ncbi:holo-ACP synthase [Fusobacterium sp.]|uniref:holo-ACP synthase n=1 Tax=Fusobacterium sp. TaxID=68766 RepID=UPI0026017D81|nr:holo-ACP synthase [Fusobacterium sp.]
MTFLGIGNDIIEISRIEKAIAKEIFIKKVFTENEIALISKKGNKAESFAGRFSAKEAISKALGTGVRNFSLTDIEILNNDLGKPYVIFKNNIENFNDKYFIDISISHCKDYATAVAIIFTK